MNNAPPEIPSGKDRAYENFPVGSWLLPAALRPHIWAFYRFARAADDIADAPDFSPADKRTRLDQYEDTITGKLTGEAAPIAAREMVQSLRETRTIPAHCLALLTAFKQDATKRRYENWQELLDYCQLSAAPVGRTLLDLHGGSRDGYGPSDALCAALQILNHLQDCQDDYQTLDRVYLPAAMLARHDAKVEDLTAPAITPPLRHCFNDILDGVDDLMVRAAGLPGGLKSYRLAMEATVIINIANRLSRKLRHHDPLQKRLELSKLEYLGCFIMGVLQSLIR